MTAEIKDLETYKNRTGILPMDKMNVMVRVKDVRRRYGHVDLLVSPMVGSGEQWIEARRVSIMG